MAMGNPMGGYGSGYGMYPSYTGTWGYKGFKGGKGRGKGRLAVSPGLRALRQVEVRRRRSAAPDPHGATSGTATGARSHH